MLREFQFPFFRQGRHCHASAESQGNFFNKNISKNHKYRKCKVIDIRENKNQVDPYGNLHKMPNKPRIKINSYKPRDIKVIEIK